MKTFKPRMSLTENTIIIGDVEYQLDDLDDGFLTLHELASIREKHPDFLPEYIPHEYWPCQ